MSHVYDLPRWNRRLNRIVIMLEHIHSWFIRENIIEISEKNHSIKNIRTLIRIFYICIYCWTLKLIFSFFNINSLVHVEFYVSLERVIKTLSSRRFGQEKINDQVN